MTTTDPVDLLVQIMLAWAARDKFQAQLTNGMLSQADRDKRFAAANVREADASSRLRGELSDGAWKELSFQIKDFRPNGREAPGEVASRFGDIERSTTLAAGVLKRAQDAEAASMRAAEQRRLKAERNKEVEQQRELAKAQAKRDERARKDAADRDRILHKAKLDEQNRLAAERQKLIRSALAKRFQSDFLSADRWFEITNNGEMTIAEYESAKADFVQAWARSLKDEAAEPGHEELDKDQAAAVAPSSSDVHVVARAGSGKTRALVTRALFLQTHCGVKPEEILLVAFNRKAAREMKERVAAKLPPGVRPPHAMTFHALAYAIVRPNEDLVYDDDDADAPKQSAKVQEAIDGFIARPADQKRVRAAMLEYFRSAWESIERQGLLYEREEFFDIRRGTKMEALKGDFVKSYGEKLIANTLFENDITYDYERNFTREGFNYRPDFTLSRNKKPAIVIEYFGIRGDPDYDEESERKRQFWAKQQDVEFVELSSVELGAEGSEAFAARLVALLSALGVPSQRLTEDEIWEKVHRRAVDRFSKTVKTFVGRARQRDLTAAGLSTLVDGHSTSSSAETDFLDLAKDVYRDYLILNREQGSEDFSGLIWRAADAIRQGQTQFQRDGGRESGDVSNFRHVLVDEFQDFSSMFHNLVESLRSVSPSVEFFCVGDDWQAINGFAGSDLRYFNDFDKYFLNGKRREIPTNYRSPRHVVGLGNVVMSGQGVEAKASRRDLGQTKVAYSDQFQPTTREQDRYGGDVMTPILLRILQQEIQNSDNSIAVLFRRNTIPWFVEALEGKVTLPRYGAFIREHYPELPIERLNFTTAHKYKGREADVVIVPDGNGNSYPLIHPTWPLFRIFGDDLESLSEAERRLFYVATTRAMKSLYYVASTKDISPFLQELIAASAAGREDASLELLNVESLPPVTYFGEAKLEVRIFDGREVKTDLMRCGFKYDGQTFSWYKLGPEAGFDFEAVCRWLSFIEHRRIEVRSEDGSLLHERGNPPSVVKLKTWSWGS